MRRLMFTCGCDPSERGPRRDLLNFAIASFQPYASRHGYEYKTIWYEDIATEKWPGLLEGRRPEWRGHPGRTSPCWLKIPAIAEALNEYDEVLYLDQDCVVLDDEQDISREVPTTAWLAMNETFIGGPCIGFVFTRNCRDAFLFWHEAWYSEAWKTATWTDNGQVLALLGYTTTAPAIWLQPTRFTPGFYRLPEAWGGVGAPYGGKPFLAESKIYHVAYHPSPEWKLAVMKDSLERKKTWTTQKAITLSR
jgi:hypothetical protein